VSFLVNKFSNFMNTTLMWKNIFKRNYGSDVLFLFFSDIRKIYLKLRMLI